MDECRPDHFGGLPPTQAYRVDAMCRCFESEWRVGGEPRIEDFLVRAAPPQRAALFRELLALEVELRRDRGERPDPREYRARFPDRAAAIGAVIGPESPTSTGGGSGPTDVSAPRPLNGVSPSRIGPYKLVRQLGEGGMGVVYMAEQETPIRRRVALKIIRPGLDTKQVVARFEAERQALALMDHPGIARVLDAGTTDTGQHYFVMELVDGLPITDFCDRYQLTPAERLELFIRVCQAIQHAHQKGIIHRDIKPSNVLVALDDGRPLPKVIDFGLAKAIDQRLADRTLYTQFGQIVGTLEYMSPEQAAMGAVDIDTRSDNYSLGVVLYELLTGSTPLGRATLRQADPAEILRRIREEEPPKPSTRLETNENLASIAGRRQTEPARLSRRVRGELDWIVMKALEKDRARRYETASGFARDIRRHLDGDSVEAGPPSGRYRLGKFARKHCAALTTAAAFGAMLIGATLISTWQALRAIRGEDKARRSESEVRAVLGFFRDEVVAAARPEGRQGGLGIDVTLRQALDSAEGSIATNFADRPTIEASIRDTLGESYQYLGDPAPAIRQHERARALRGASLGPDHPDTLASMNNLAMAYMAIGRTADGVALLEETLKLLEAKLGPAHPDALSGLNNLGMAYWTAGRNDEALPLFERARALRAASLGPDHPDTLTSMSNLAVAYLRAGRVADAIALQVEALNLKRAKLGPDHPDTLISMSNLASAYRHAGRVADAVALCEETLKLYRAKLGPDHPDTLVVMCNLAVNYRDAGRAADAIALQVEALKLKRAKLGPDHPDTLVSRYNLALSYHDAGRVTDAVATHEQTLVLQRAKLGPDHPDTLNTMNALAVGYREAGRLKEAIPLLEESLVLQRAKLGPDHPSTLMCMNNLAGTYLAAERWREAETTLRGCLGLRDRKQPDDWWRFHTMSQLGAALAGQAKYPESEPLLIQGYEGLKSREPRIPAPSRKQLAAAAARIVPFYEAWGRPEQAASWRAKLGLAGRPADPCSSEATRGHTPRAPEGRACRPRQDSPP
jgi:serine/threonine protein kinase/tetratricopeptide (TPR) repeat protein